VFYYFVLTVRRRLPVEIRKERIILKVPNLNSSALRPAVPVPRQPKISGAATIV